MMNTKENRIPAQPTCVRMRLLDTAVPQRNSRVWARMIYDLRTKNPK